MTAPVVPLPLWEQVITAADRVCECAGECGNRHSRTGGRCDREHGSYARGHTGPIRLIAAPRAIADLALPAQRQAALPAARLAAWCPTCHDAARTIARREDRKTRAQQMQDATDTLFDVA